MQWKQQESKKYVSKNESALYTVKNVNFKQEARAKDYPDAAHI